MTGNEGCLKHDVSQLAPPFSNGAFTAYDAAVMCDWGQACERGGLLT